jgi:hypothetical protein
MNDHMGKPFDPEDLLRILRLWLRPPRISDRNDAASHLAEGLSEGL